MAESFIGPLGSSMVVLFESGMLRMAVLLSLRRILVVCFRHGRFELICRAFEPLPPTRPAPFARPR